MENQIEVNQVYTFKELEKYLGQWEARTHYLKVRNIEHNNMALMLIFPENFCTGIWLSGDGVLFYLKDSEVHSANDEDEFKVLEILTI